ncbi:MAG: methyltransferase domain-containing protein [Pseudomonadota bacterium]
MTPQYPDHFVARLETLWGEGFLSPGGADEVREIVKGLALESATLLDIGCGTGGADLVLVEELGAAFVAAVDVEPKLIERARCRVRNAGLEGRIDCSLVTPGPLPFPDEAFDVVFSKDALVHVEDKPALFREVRRVLKPGGVFAASDWLAGDNLRCSRAWAAFRQIGHLSLTMATAAESVCALRQAGFWSVTSRDRNAWYREVSAWEAEQVAGPLRDRLLSLVDREVYDHWLAVRRALAATVADGALRPTHLRAFKP